MNLHKAIEQLRRLAAANSPDDLLKFSLVQALLAGFEEENRAVDGSMINAYSAEKIGSVRTWFAILCGIGEDGFTPEKARENAFSDIGKLANIISRDGLSLEHR